MKKRTWIIGAVVVVALVAGGAAVMKGKNGDEKIDEKLVMKLTRKDLAIEVVDTGKVQAKERVSIKSKVAGQVTEVLVDEGAHVEKGQLLLKLDPVEYQRDVARVEAEAGQVESALELARASLARKQRGLEERVVSAADVELAQSEVKMKEAQKRSADTLLAAARDRLAYTRITSPLAGTVIERGIQAGEVVTPGVQATFEGKALLVVADVSTLVVRAELNQIDVAKVVMGQTVKLTLDALPGKKFDATITKIAPAAVKGSDNNEVFPVEATVIEVDPAIKAGMTADVRILVDTKKSILVLPIEAVRKKDEKSNVKKIVMKDGVKATEEVEVHTGASNDREIEITQGLNEGDEVLVDPNSAKDNEANIS
jgi:HlyD family secretion protein/macrolide-specific efflux system membrane fusion protein